MDVNNELLQKSEKTSEDVTSLKLQSLMEIWQGKKQEKSKLDNIQQKT